jgi:hypothetical protein
MNTEVWSNCIKRSAADGNSKPPAVCRRLCQNRQVADLLPLKGTPEVCMIHHPDFGNDFTNQLSMTEKSD